MAWALATRASSPPKNRDGPRVGKATWPGRVISTRGVSASRVATIGSKTRASRAGSWSSTTSDGQRDCASRRRWCRTMSCSRAAGDMAATRLAWKTAAGSSSGTPAATIGQSPQRTTSVRTAAPSSARQPHGSASCGTDAGATRRLAPGRTGATAADAATSAVGAGQPEVGAAGLGRLAPTAAGDPELAGLEVAVAVVEPLPAAARDLELEVGALRPARTELQQHRPALPGPGDEAAGIGGAHARAAGVEDHEVEAVDQRRHHPAPRVALGGGHQHEPLEGDAELVGRHQPQRRQPHRRHPGALLARPRPPGPAPARWPHPRPPRTPIDTVAPRRSPPPGSRSSKAGSTGSRCSRVSVTGRTRSASSPTVLRAAPLRIPTASNTCSMLSSEGHDVRLLRQGAGRSLA